MGASPGCSQGCVPAGFHRHPCGKLRTGPTLSLKGEGELKDAVNGVGEGFGGN